MPSGMGDVLIFGDTIRHAELRHELPLDVPDSFLYAEVGGVRHAVVSSLERARVAAVGGRVEVHAVEEFGYDELVLGGSDRSEALLEVAARACRTLGLERAVVPSDFPLAVADRLRADGIALTVDREQFEARRRVKSRAELDGIRRAQAAAEAGMRAARELLRQAEPNGAGLDAGGEPLTCERVKGAIRDAVARAGANAGDVLIVSHGEQTASGHESGSGPIKAGEPVIIDLWPRDPDSACFADMTRTFVVGEAPAESAATTSSPARHWLARSRPCDRGRPRARCFASPASPTSRPACRRSSARRRARCSRRGTSTRWAMALGSRCTRRRRSAAHPICSLPAMSSRSSPAATARASAAAGWRTWCW